MSLSITQDIFDKVSRLTTRSIFRRPETFPLGTGSGEVPPGLSGRLDLRQFSLLSVGSGTQLAISAGEILTDAQDLTFQFPDASLFARQRKRIEHIAGQFFGRGPTCDYPAMLWTFPVCYSNRWTLAQHGARADARPEEPKELTAAAFVPFGGVEIPVRNFDWAPPCGDDVGYSELGVTMTGNRPDGTLVSASNRRQVGRGCFSREFDGPHSRTHHAAQEERLVSQDPDGTLLDSQLVKMGRLVPLCLESDNSVRKAFIEEITFAVDRDTGAMVYVASRTDVFGVVSSHYANAAGEAEEAIYRPFLQS
jgi:hypothetical protein